MTKRRGGFRRGQGLVELMLVLPILVIMALAVFDFARVLSHAITLESAAREAADYGGLYPWHWQDASSATTTTAEIQTRACTASSTLTDYIGDDPEAVAPGDPVTCTNPEVSVDLINNTAYASCFDVPRDQVPCRVEVTVDYEFEVIVPLRLTFGDTVLGLPPSVDLVRTSTFAVSNFELDESLAP